LGDARLLWTFSAVLDVPFAKAKSLLFHVPADREGKPMLPFVLRWGQSTVASGQWDIRGGPEQFTIRYGPKTLDSRLRLELHQAEARWIVQGNWWYRGECELAPLERGCELTYRVYDATGNPAWLMSLFHRFNHHRAKVKRDFDRLVQAVYQHIGLEE